MTLKQMVYKADRESETLAEGTYKGLDYIILSLGTHPTAYVRVPKTHPYFRKGYDNVDIRCHGGLTFASDRVAKEKKHGWWLGWDYAHLGDYSGYEMRGGLGDWNDYKWSTEEILTEVKEVIDQLLDPRHAAPNQ